MKRPARPRRKKSRGQAALESVMVLMLLLLIFFSLFQVSYLFICRIIAHHTAFVTTRSYIVGFDEKIVNRAREVGSIPLAGNITQPAALVGASPAQLGAIEPSLIAEFVQASEYLMWYEHWNKVDHNQPVLDVDGPVDIKVEVRNYPLEIPMSGAYMGARRTVDFESEATMRNHAGYYLD